MAIRKYKHAPSARGLSCVAPETTSRLVLKSSRGMRSAAPFVQMSDLPTKAIGEHAVSASRGGEQSPPQEGATRTA
eukprot:11246048-Alexandrium_andersonii.AAC.1